MNLSIIIPVYHEEDNILNVIKAIEAAVKTDHELCIVYDTPSDPTYPVVKKYLHQSQAKSIRLIRNSTGNGRGVMNAIKTGIICAKSEVLAVVMADMADDITQLDEMYDLTQSGYDLVCASRYMRGGRHEGGPLIKSLMSKTAGITLHYLARIRTHDSTNAFKMYRKQLFDVITIESCGGFEYSLELVVKAYKSKFRITEIPTIWKDRTCGKSNFQLRKWLPHYFKWYVYAFKSHPDSHRKT